MGQTGRFGQLFRTGSESNSNMEIILQSLQNGLGTGFDSLDQDTIVYIENYSIAKAINGLWESNKRLANQFNPSTLSAFLTRWEGILGIPQNPQLSIEDRKNNIAFKFLLWSNPATSGNVYKYVQEILGKLSHNQNLTSIFVRIEYNAANQNEGSYFGGLTVEGGVSLPELDEAGRALFTSDVSELVIRIWQPRDHNDNKLMPDSIFFQLNQSFYTFLDNYLPSYMTYRSFRYVNNGPGTITIDPAAVGSISINPASDCHTVTGSGTSFTSIFLNGSQFSWTDNNGFMHISTVANIISDTNLQTVECAGDAATSVSFFPIGQCHQVVGSGTTFTQTFDVGEQFEGVDDLGNLQTYTIASITDDTHLTTLECNTTNTNGFYRVLGFFLDNHPNIGFESFQ